MEGLTKKNDGAPGYYMACSDNCASDAEMCGGCPWLDKIINRLGAYEDSGLEPEEVGKVRDAYASIAGKGVSGKRIHELIRAEREGRMVVLPCKVGDTVFQADGVRVYESKVKAIVYDTGLIAFDERAIGSSVFLAREEAEAALEAQKGGEGNG